MRPALSRQILGTVLSPFDGTVGNPAWRRSSIERGPPLRFDLIYKFIGADVPRTFVLFDCDNGDAASICSTPVLGCVARQFRTRYLAWMVPLPGNAQVTCVNLLMTAGSGQGGGISYACCCLKKKNFCCLRHRLAWVTYGGATLRATPWT